MVHPCSILSARALLRSGATLPPLMGECLLSGVGWGAGAAGDKRPSMKSAEALEQSGANATPHVKTLCSLSPSPVPQVTGSVVQL